MLGTTDDRGLFRHSAFGVWLLESYEVKSHNCVSDEKTRADTAKKEVISCWMGCLCWHRWSSQSQPRNTQCESSAWLNIPLWARPYARARYNYHSKTHFGSIEYSNAMKPQPYRYWVVSWSTDKRLTYVVEAEAALYSWASITSEARIWEWLYICPYAPWLRKNEWTDDIHSVER